MTRREQGEVARKKAEEVTGCDDSKEMKWMVIKEEQADGIQPRL